MPKVAGTLKIVNADGGEFTEADLDAWTRLYVEGVSGLTADTTLGELTALVEKWALLIQRPPEADEDDVDYRISAGLKELKPPYEWRIILDVRAKVTGDYVVAMAMPGEPVQLAAHRIRFGEYVPPDPDPMLTVDPLDMFISSGPAGGPFEPPEAVYTLSNTGRGALQWSVNCTQPWLVAVPSSGVLAEGQSVETHIGFTEQAKQLPDGVHAAIVNFVNVTNGKGDSMRPVMLRVEGDPSPDHWQIAIFHESDDLENLPIEQRELISGLKFRQDFEAKGHVFHRAVDVSTIEEKGVDPEWEALWEAAKGKPTPRLAGAPKDGGAVQTWPLPANTEALYQLLENP